MASIIKINDKWRAQVRQRGHKPQTRTFSTKALATQWARQIESDIDTGRATTTPVKRVVTIAALIERYAEEVGSVKPMGVNKTTVHRLIKRYLGKEDACSLTTDRLVRYVTKEREIRDVTAGLDLSYLKGVLKIAKALWREPVMPSVVDDTREVLRYMGLLNNSNERDRRPTAAELTAIRDYLEKRPTQFRPDILDFILASCFRPPSEILRLRWADLNIEDRTIVIHDRKDPRKKIGNNQTVPLLNGSFDIVMRQPQVSEFIFPLHRAQLCNTWPEACRDLDIKDLRLYDMRHEAISRLVEANKHSIPEMMLVTGHKNPKQLMRYTQLRAKDLHR
jgi:integrase